MIGVRVRFQRIAEREVETLDECQVALDLGSHRIDGHRLAGCAVDQEIRERRRLDVEELDEVVFHGLILRPICDNPQHPALT